jgi:ATP-binding cassette subfamily B protein/ATP-binding cassette subfamily C protein LapB
VQIDPEMTSEKAVPASGRPAATVWLALRNVWQANRRHVLVLMIAGVVINILSLLIPVFSIIVYDKIIGNSAYASLWALSLGIGVAMIMDVALRQMRVVIIEHVGARWDQALDENVFHGVQRVPLTKMPRVGAVMVKYRELMGAREFLSSAYLLPIVDFPFIAIFLFVLFLIGGPIWLVALFWGSVLLIASIGTQRKALVSYQKASKHSGEKMSILVDTIVAAEMARVPSVGTRALGRFLGHAEASARAGADARLWIGLSQSLMPAVSALAVVSTLVVGTVLVEAQSMTLGTLIACSTIVSRSLGLFGSLAGLLSRYKDFVRTASEFGSLVPFADPKASRKALRRGIKSRLPKAMYSLIGVTVDRQGGNGAILDDISLRFGAPEFVVVLGRSGSGKSTLLRMLAGRLVPSRGAIIAGGVEITTNSLSWLAGCVGYKQQEPSFTSASVAELLQENGPGTTPALRLETLRRVGLGPALDAGELSLSTSIQSVSAGISGGQKQMLALACALLQGTEVLILDEPTAGLDAEATANVLEVLRSLKGKSLVIVATHSEEMVTLADRLVVIESGKVRADGRPADLLVTKREKRLA